MLITITNIDECAFILVISFPFIQDISAHFFRVICTLYVQVICACSVLVATRFFRYQLCLYFLGLTLTLSLC